MSKKLSIVPNLDEAGQLASLGLLSTLDSKGPENDLIRAATLKLNESRLQFSKISNHFVFGSHSGVAHSDALVNKTSNNKLDQSYKISYADMVDILKNYKSPLQDTTDAVNCFFEKSYFPEWMKFMK